MIKLIAKSYLRLSSQPIYMFSQKREHYLLISRELLNKYHEFKPQKNIRLMHSITMSRYDPQIRAEQAMSKREDQLKIQQIISSLSGELHQIPHLQMNMLLEILKQRGYKYDRNAPIFKSLNKQARMLIFSKQYQGDLLIKTLYLLKMLQFPKSTWAKTIENFLHLDPEQTSRKQKLRMSQRQFFNLVILVLQQPFVPLVHIKSFIERLVKEKANNLSTLSSLYHISNILQNSLKTKIDYQYTRSTTKQIIFNSYLNEQQKPKQQGDTCQQEGDSQKMQLKLKLQQISNEVIKIFTSSVDVRKLEQEIIKSIQSDIQPITKQIVINASDISELKTTIEKFIAENLDKLTPVQFVHLVKKCSLNTIQSNLDKYLEKLGKFMSVQQKIFLLMQYNRNFHKPITLEIILQLVSELQSINYAEFISVTRLVQLLSKQDQSKISQILSLIKSKIKQHP